MNPDTVPSGYAGANCVRPRDDEGIVPYRQSTTPVGRGLAPAARSRTYVVIEALFI